MLKLIINKMKSTFILCLALALCTSCSEKNIVKLPVIEDYDTIFTYTERKNLKLGVVTGPYGDMFKEIIEPLYSQKGYNVELVLFDNYNDPNFALANGEIDMNMFQNYVYLTEFNFNNDLNLSAISEIPTVSMGIYSNRYNSIDDLTNGLITAIPSDSTNLSRALTVLEDSGMIVINPSVDKTRATLDDLIKNPKNLKFTMIDAQLLTESLDDYDLAVINGNFALSGGLNASEALYSESLSEGYINIIAVRTEDLREVFVMDLINVLRSKEYIERITDKNSKYNGFQPPRNFITIRTEVTK